MEVIIKFNNQDGEEDYLTALNGWKYKLVLFDLMNLLRSYEKGWSNEEFSTDMVRQFIIDKLEKHTINL
jgi:hypothetical protein